jgi:hypothetical protein
VPRRGREIENNLEKGYPEVPGTIAGKCAAMKGW